MWWKKNGELLSTTCRVTAEWTQSSWSTDITYCQQVPLLREVMFPLPGRHQNKRKGSFLSTRVQIHCFSSLRHYLMLFQNHTESLHPSQQVNNSTPLLQLTFHWLFYPPCHPQSMSGIPILDPVCWKGPLNTRPKVHQLSTPLYK